LNVLFFTDVLEIGIARYTAPYRLATELRKHGHTCQVIDFYSAYNDGDLKRILDKFISDDSYLLAFTNTFIYTEYTATKFLTGSNQKHFLDSSIYGDLRAKIEYITFEAQKINQNIKTVMGGSSAHIIDLNCIDYWVTGLGDNSLPSLLDSLKTDKPIIRKKLNDGTLVINSNDDYPYDEFNTSTIEWTKQEAVQPDEWVPIEISRGCKFRCSFCYFPLNGKKADDYLKTEETLKEELIRNYEDFGITNYVFSDDLYNDSIEKVEKYHRVFTSLPFKISWVSYGRLDLIHAYPQMRELLLESGCKSLYLGIETFNKKAGGKVGKGLGKEKIIKTLKYLNETWKGKINLGAGFIIGLPTESKESLQDTFKWLISDENTLDFFIFYPLHIQEEKTTDIYQANMSSNPEKYGYEFESKNSQKWKTEEMTFDEANRIASSYNFTASQKTSLGGFMIPRLCNLGYNMESFMNRKIIKDVMDDKSKYKEMKSKFISKYLTEILNLNIKEI
jgi:radical SAM superfamily enzyme YgiQ (UPF0313 family)